MLIFGMPAVPPSRIGYASHLTTSHRCRQQTVPSAQTDDTTSRAPPKHLMDNVPHIPSICAEVDLLSHGLETWDSQNWTVTSTHTIEPQTPAHVASAWPVRLLSPYPT